MSLAPKVAANATSGLPLHTVWWQVLKPRQIVGPDGNPGYEISGTTETLAEAVAVVRGVPGGVIVQNVVVFVNPQVTSKIVGMN